MKVCESCGMPLEAKTTSKFDARYCIYCQDQKTGKLATREQVREGIMQNYFMAHEKMNRKQAEKATDQMMTKLPRWKK